MALAFSETAAATRPGALVLVKNVSKTFVLHGQSVPALDGITATIEPAEFITIVGPSGCGKSTLLRILAGLETPTAGEVEIDGEPPAALSRRHELGVAFQEHALLPWLTVEKNIALVMRLARRPVDHQRVLDLMRLVGLSDFANARPRHLSGGMKQRVSIARSMALAPRVLLLDEPFGALDLVTRRSLNLEMAKLWGQSQITTLLVTHSVEEAVLLADRVIVMSPRPGRIVDTFKVVADRPRSRSFTQATEYRDLCARVTDSLDRISGGVA